MYDESPTMEFDGEVICFNIFEEKWLTIEKLIRPYIKLNPSQVENG